MTDVKELTIIGSIDPIKKGDTFTDWPLHVTVLPRVSVVLDSLIEFNAVVQKQVDVYDNLTIVGHERALYGLANDMLVREVKSEGLELLHYDLIDALAEHNIPTQPYVSNNYSPHVTNIGDRGLSFGESFQLDILHLIMRTNRLKSGKTVKRVLHEYPFKKVSRAKN